MVATYSAGGSLSSGARVRVKGESPLPPQNPAGLALPCGWRRLFDSVGGFDCEKDGQRVGCICAGLNTDL